MKALSDAELITSVRAGSDAAFAVLYERHSGSARAAARSLGASRADVDDLVSEAFTRVLSALQRGGGPEIAFRPYLMTCVRNAWYDKTRKDGRVDVPGEVPEDVNLALLNVPPDSEDARMVAAAFASLPERWQMVLWHTEVEGRPAADVGPLLGLAPNAVAALAYRAREGLRQAYLQAHLQLPPPDACRDTIAKLGAYVRDGLSARDRRKVDEHLKHCDRCTALLVELQEVSSSLRGVLVPILLGVTGSAFLAKLAAGGGALAVLARLRPRTPTAQAAAVASAAAAVVAGVLTISAVTGRGGEQVAATGGPTTTAVAAASAGANGSTNPAAPSAAASPPASAAPPPVPFVPASATTAAVVAGGAVTPSVRVQPVNPTTTSPPRSPSVTAARQPEPTAPATPDDGTGPDATDPAPTAPPTTPLPTTAPPPTSTTAPTTTTTAPPAGPAPLNVTASAVGPAYAGLSGTIKVTAEPGEAGSTLYAAVGRSLTLQAEPAGPVTVASDAPVLDWGVSGCAAGPSCVLPAGTSELTVRLDLSHAAQDKPFPVTITASAAGGATATATVPLAPVARPAGLEFFTVDHGGLAVAANTVVTCVPPAGTCGPNNNETDVGYVDNDSAVLNASSANLTVPAGASIAYASLRWGGDPARAPDLNALGSVKLRLPGATEAVDVTTTVLRKDPGSAYAAGADVTALLQPLANASGTYQVADVQTGTGHDQFGGWSLLVVYRQPDAPIQNLAVFDDPSSKPSVLTRVDQHNQSLDVSLTGLTAPAKPVDVQFAMAAYEGDHGIVGDKATVGGVDVGTPDNFFDSTVDVGATRDPAFSNQYGFDAKSIDVKNGFRPGQSDVAVRFTTTGDTIFLGFVALAVPV